ENLWTKRMPKKELEDIPVKDLSSAPEVREHPVGLGPFKVKEMMEGEYVSLERFDDYWKGKPKLAEVMIKVIDPSLTIGALQNGDGNLLEIRPDDVEEMEKFDH